MSSWRFCCISTIPSAGIKICIPGYVRNVQKNTARVYLISVVSPGKCLRHLQEPPPGILSQIHVVLLVILVHHLRLQIFLSRFTFFMSDIFPGEFLPVWSCQQSDCQDHGRNQQNARGSCWTPRQWRVTSWSGSSFPLEKPQQSWWIFLADFLSYQDETFYFQTSGCEKPGPKNKHTKFALDV